MHVGVPYQASAATSSPDPLLPSGCHDWWEPATAQRRSGGDSRAQHFSEGKGRGDHRKRLGRQNCDSSKAQSHSPAPHRAEEQGRASPTTWIAVWLTDSVSHHTTSSSLDGPGTCSGPMGPTAAVREVAPVGEMVDAGSTESPKDFSPQCAGSCNPWFQETLSRR